MTQLYADSTVAMSAYNFLVNCGGPMRRRDVHEFLTKTVHPGLTAKQLDDAMNCLNSLKLTFKHAHGDCIKDLRRRFIIARNRNDMKECEDGKISGGWTGWKWRDETGKIGSVFANRKTIKLEITK